MPNVHQFLVNLPAKNSSEEAQFLLALGFTELYPPVMENCRLFSDGQLQLQLSTAGGLRAGLVMLTDQPLDKLAVALQQTGYQTAIQDTKIQQVAPDGTVLYWLHQPKQDFPPLPTAAKTLCGNFYELSLEVADLEACRSFWEAVGFKKILPEGDRSSWLTLSNSLLKIGLYQQGSCPHPFNSPAFTFFNADAGSRLASLQQQGFSLAHVLPAAGGQAEEAILETPQGHHLFLFKAW